MEIAIEFPLKNSRIGDQCAFCGVTMVTSSVTMVISSVTMVISSVVWFCGIGDIGMEHSLGATVNKALILNSKLYNI